MAKSILEAGFTHNEDEAYAFLERVRWPQGPVCPHCQHNKAYRLKPSKTGRRVLKCAKCRKQFSVTVGTIFEDSHISLTKWLSAMHLMCASKKGISSHQLHRMLGVTYKTAWFMSHRIRHAMNDSHAMGKLKGTVECDETYIGGKKRIEQRYDNKTPVFSLVQREGTVRSFVITNLTASKLKEIIRDNVEREARIMTDEFRSYMGLKYEFLSHDTVNHSAKEYVRGHAHTNTVEGYFSLLKRGIVGTFHHVGSQHLHRYLAEFDFRYNGRKLDDATRSILATRMIEGKRLQYQ